MRLPAGLQALAAAGYLGRMHREYEDEIAQVLHEAGVIVSTMPGSESGVSRKWRHACVKMGFIYPDGLEKPYAHLDTTVLGQPYTLTPNGSRLIAAESVHAQQDVILRAMAAIQLPSPVEPEYRFPPFSPLRHVVRLLLALGDTGQDQVISRLEMATIVQFSTSADLVEDVVARIAAFRRARDLAPSKRQFASTALERMKQETGYAQGTPFDYQNLNFRYLRATGLVQSKGRDITLVRENMRLARMLADELDSPLGPIEYVERLSEGAHLPTDDVFGAQQALQDLVESATERGIEFNLDGRNLTTAQDIAITRFDLQELIDHDKETEFAAKQHSQIDEILAYLEVIETGKSKRLGDDTVVVPSEERPAYFEWALWRAFLALRDLHIAPHQVRRFKVDQDFLPVGHAPGGASDLIAVYEEEVVVIEVTLTSNSRQEAAEGEPVRRHVANEVENYLGTGKSVYGLFIAPVIDSNAAETFRIGVWYLRNDVRTTLDIAPMTLKQFRTVLQSANDDGELHPRRVLGAIRSINAERETAGGAPEWKTKISELLGA